MPPAWRAERRDETQAALLGALAAEVAVAPDDAAAQGADFAFFATLIDASGNLVLLLVANSIRDLYFARLADFRALVRDRAALGPRYAEAAAAVAAGDGEAAALRRARARRGAGGGLAGGPGMRAREARAAAALIDAVAAPEPPLPPVERTDAVAAFASWLALAPRPTAPCCAPRCSRSPPRASRVRDRAGRLALLRGSAAPRSREGLRATAAVSYYGDARRPRGPRRKNGARRLSCIAAATPPDRARFRRDRARQVPGTLLAR